MSENGKGFFDTDTDVSDGRYFLAYCVDRDYEEEEIASGSAKKLMAFDGSGYIMMCSFVSRELRMEAIRGLYDAEVLSWPVPNELAYMQARCCGSQGKTYIDEGIDEETVLGMIRNYDELEQFWRLEGQWVVKNEGSLGNVSALSGSGERFVEKISGAVDGICDFWVKGTSDGSIEVEDIDLWQRTSRRSNYEEMVRQKNMESIVGKALLQVKGKDVGEMDGDWIVVFFDKCRIVSDDEMQYLWSCVLAKEASKPGTYSKRDLCGFADMDEVEFRQSLNFCTDFRTGDIDDE